MHNLNCKNIYRTLSSGEILLDVRNKAGFYTGSLANAKNVPLAELPLLAQQYYKKDDPVLIFCHSDNRAIIAEKILQAMGFTDITNMGSTYSYLHCH